MSMNLKNIWVASVIVVAAGGGMLGAAENYTRNGDFEQVKEDQAAFWETTGTVKPEQVSGGWQRLTGKFTSGEHDSVNFLFFMFMGSMGSVWLDNITFSPAATIENASFEELGPDGLPAACSISYGNVAVFSDSTRAASGKKSLRMTHEHEAVPETQMRQKLGLKPNQDYTFSFDVFVGDDFQGEAMGCVEGRSDYLAISTLAETRDRCGRNALALLPSATAPAGVSQEIGVAPGMNLQASVDLNNKAFAGRTRLVVEDLASGRILGETGLKEVGAKWQSLQVAFQSVSPKLRIRVIAEGVGSLQVDNVEITPPRIAPPMQQVHWLPAAENYFLSSPLAVSVQGQTGKAIDGGLELFGRDLKKHNVTLARTESAETPLKIVIGSAFAVADKGPEAYSLTVNRKGITIKAGAEPGAFYGLMSLLQLLESRDGKPVVLACDVTDYPDMPLRGVLYADPEQAARWKMNTFMESTGLPSSIEQRKALSDSVLKCEKLNLKFIPYFLTMMGGHYVQKINPNLAAGIWVQGEKVILNGTEPSPLANPFVIRTKLTDVELKSPDGAIAYQLGKDYQVIDGDMKWNYGWNGEPIPGYTPKPFTVARLPGSAIPDGATVLASYDWVSHHRASDNRTETHIAYVPLEPETRRLMDDYLRNLARDYSFPYIEISNDFHEFGPNDAQLATDSRVIKSGRKPIQLFAEDVRFQAAAIKQGNPKTKVLQDTGSMLNPYVREGEPFLPRDACIDIWGYDANWPAVYGREAMEFWSKLGFETLVTSWDNLRNVRGWAQVVAEARAKGYPCVGMINACWANRTGGFQETASVAWRIPKAGEKGFIALPPPTAGAVQPNTLQRRDEDKPQE